MKCKNSGARSDRPRRTSQSRVRTRKRGHAPASVQVACTSHGNPRARAALTRRQLVALAWAVHEATRLEKQRAETEKGLGLGLASPKREGELYSEDPEMTLRHARMALYRLAGTFLKPGSMRERLGL
jgi:hypothetical protein